MHRLSIAVAAISTIAFAQVASAADLPRKATAVLPPPPVIGWTGFYTGLNVGYGWGGHLDVAGTGTSISFPGLIPITNSLAFEGAHSQNLSGVIGGGQVGYNYQFSPKWVLGLEADIQGSGQRKTSTFADPIAAAFCNGAQNPPPTCFLTNPFNGAAVTGYEAKIDWFGTVRGRVGWLVTDQVLLYATGGLAYGQVGVSGNVNVSGSQPSLPAFTWAGTSGFSASKTNIGFVVGGGIEGKFTAWLSQNWSWKLEYLYLDLGSLDASAPFVAVSSLPIGITDIVGATTYHAHFTDNIVRVGINYKFN
jgi:outer membrane immunogenic protein